MLGDGTLFAHRDGVEATWKLMTPVLRSTGQERPQVTDFPNYAAGTWGPEASDAMLHKLMAAAGANSNTIPANGHPCDGRLTA